MDIEMLFRLIILLVFVLTFSISATFRKRARESGEVVARREEGISVFILRMVLAIPLLASILLTIFYPRALNWATIHLPLWLRSFAAVGAMLCVPIILWVFRSIGRNISETVLTKSDHELVKHGPYRWVRHPLYASTLLLLFSISLIAGNWFIFVYCVIGLFVFRFLVIPAEEEKLVASFGEEYEKYRLRTGALIPKLF
ncbi:MAG: hypothetical protein GTO14_06380 [Anaerolineales bacterium]|nr:hypothetical protein [Anaerolineales bacterium]